MEIHLNIGHFDFREHPDAKICIRTSVRTPVTSLLYLAWNDRKVFSLPLNKVNIHFWSCQNVCDALSYLLDNIYIRI